MSVQKAALRERTREIARVFIRHGFGFLLRDLDWRQVGKGDEGLLVAKDFYTDAQQEKIRTMSQRLPLMLEELGPTFIKFGQFLSSRPDLLPDFLLEALERLHEQVAPIPFAEVEAALDGNLPSWRQDFLQVEPEPLGMGSIAQIHRARLQDGRVVVVKVRKPGVVDTIEVDLAILKRTAAFIGEQPEVKRIIALEQLVSVFAHGLQKETDFAVEAVNMTLFARKLPKDGRIRIPACLPEWSNQAVLTMEYIEALSLEQALKQPVALRKKWARSLLDSFLGQVFVYGFFHADPHPGNLRFDLLGDVIYFDFGLVGRMESRMQRLLFENFLAIRNLDVEGLMNVSIAMGKPMGDISWQNYYEDTAELLFMALDAGHSSGGLGGIMTSMFKVAQRYGVRMPERMLFFAKALAMTEGVARRLDPDINLERAVEEVLEAYVRQQLEVDFSVQALELKKKWQIFSHELPYYVSALTRGEKRIPIEIGGMEHIGDSLQRAVHTVAYSLVIASLVVTAGIMMSAQGAFEDLIRTTGYLLLLGAISASVYLYLRIFRHVRR